MSFFLIKHLFGKYYLFIHCMNHLYYLLIVQIIWTHLKQEIQFNAYSLHRNGTAIENQRSYKRRESVSLYNHNDGSVTGWLFNWAARRQCKSTAGQHHHAVLYFVYAQLYKYNSKHGEYLIYIFANHENRFIESDKRILIFDLVRCVQNSKCKNSVTIQVSHTYDVQR